MMSVFCLQLQLIYNGDADACVPYIGNEEWINDALVGPGLISEAETWRPWFTADTPDMPAGYVTTYNVEGGSSPMTFLTIRLAGHSKSSRQAYAYGAASVHRLLSFTDVMTMLRDAHCSGTDVSARACFDIF